MLLLEYNLDDLYTLSDEEINQEAGLLPTINRIVTSNFIDNYKVKYKENSYYNNGVFTFKVSGIRNEIYGVGPDGARYIKDKSRIGKRSIHIVKIKPRTEIIDTADLSLIDVDLFCDCNDFRYVFMNMAYKGYRSMIGKIAEYGLVPVKNQFGFAGDEDANIRNPDNMGALCKHALLVVDRLLYDVDGGMLKKIQRDIDDRNKRFEEEGPAIETPGEDDLVTFDDKFYDRNGKLKHKAKIKIARDKKIQQVIDMIEDMKYSQPLSNLRGNMSDRFNDLKESMVQLLIEFDSYYLNKAEEEGVDATKYLPFDFEDGYDTIADKMDELQAITDFTSDMTDTAIDYATKDLSDDQITNLGAYLDQITDPDIDIDDILGDEDFEDRINDLLGEGYKYIKNFKDYKKR